MVNKLKPAAGRVDASLFNSASSAVLGQQIRRTQIGVALFVQICPSAAITL
jgi:hypothetical protein